MSDPYEALRQAVDDVAWVRIHPCGEEWLQAADPSTVSALLADYDAMKAERDALAAALHGDHVTCHGCLGGVLDVLADPPCTEEPT